jgi:hypothetical protein
MLDHRRQEKNLRKKDGKEKKQQLFCLFCFAVFLDVQEVDPNQDHVHQHVEVEKNIQHDMNIVIEKIEIATVKKKNVVEIKLFFVVVIYSHK